MLNTEMNCFIKYDNDKNNLVLSYNGEERELSNDEQFMLFIALCKKFSFEHKIDMEDYFSEFQTDHAETYYSQPEYSVVYNGELYNVFLGYTIKKHQKPTANTPIPLIM